MARPKAFDPIEILDKAMRLFWRRGYEATSIQGLVDHLGINRQSLYDTYGDKIALFLRAIERYTETIIRPGLAALEAPGSPLGNVRKLIAIWAGQATNPDLPGCLITNTITEMSTRDGELSDLTHAAIALIEHRLYRALERAVEQGELHVSTDTQALARFLTGMAQGIHVMGQHTKSRESIRDIVCVTLAVLD